MSSIPLQFLLIKLYHDKCCNTIKYVGPTRMNALCECHKVSHSSCKQHIRTYVKIHNMYIRISTNVRSHLHTHLHT